jgi:beta-lactam-binding protein with PASTA domain
MMGSSPSIDARFTHALRCGRATCLAVLTVWLLAITASAASAETLMMPNRDMLMGTSQVVWGVSTLPNNTPGSPTTYAIDFGDGSAVAAGAVTDRSFIAVNHTFAIAGTFNVTLQVSNAGTTESATAVIRVFDGTLISAEQLRGVRINSAIEDGLRYLWVNQASRATNFPAGATTNWGSSYPESFAALIVLAFENHGYHLPNSDDPVTGLYQKYIVRRGMNFVIDELRQINLTAQPAGDPCVNVSDAPAPCVGLFQNQQQEGYATALAILPLAGSNALNRHVTEITGSQNSGFVVGKTYAEVLQRLIDAMAYGQGEAGFARGGWAYSFNAGNTDGSTIGWNVLALLDAAAAGITVPAFVKTEFVNFAIPYGLNNDGTFDYTSGNNPAVAQGAAGANMAKNGIGVQAMFYSDIVGLGNVQVLAGRNAISSRWNAQLPGDAYPCPTGFHNKGCGYAMFNVFKALKLQGITTLPGVNRPAGPGLIPAGDWYADYVDYLLANQNAPTTQAGGQWTSNALYFSCCGEGVVGSSALAELILSPVALIAPDPTLFSTVGLGPATALLAPGGSHTVTATATSAGGAAVAGATVNFSVLTGPNAGATGQGVTSASGQATFTYADAGGPGRDTIQAFIGTLGSNVVEALWQVPQCGQATAVLQSAMYPLDQGWRRVGINGVSGATVTQVCQDEPPNFENIAAWAIDADGVGTSSVSVRAQRSGTRTAPGNGRVYHIYYTASTCSGQVTVGVPVVANGTAVDDGALYNSVTGASCGVQAVPSVSTAPNVVGKTQTLAAADIATAGLLVGTISSLNSPTVPAGVVMSQLPGGGATVAQGSSVALTVSSGPSSVGVPNVVGKPQSTATSQISSVGLAPSVTQVNDPAIAAGLVISQAPIAGTQVPPASGVALTVSLGPAITTVPNVVDRILAGAVNSIGGAGLNLGTVSLVYNATIADGHVISQTPAGGSSVSPGSFVNFVLSLGPQPIPVPNVVGQSEAAASASITAGSMVVGAIAHLNDATIPAGQVITQSPLAGSTAIPGSKINFTVSLGPVIVTVPAVTGQTQAVAQTAIVGVGLAVGAVTTSHHPTVPTGAVISQAPAGLTSAILGSAVNLVVSLGPTPVPVPNVVGQVQATAASNIVAATLVVGAVTQANSPTVPSGSVISEAPAAGTSVLPGSAVNLVISLGPVMVPVPNVVGNTQAVATASIAAAHLNAAVTFAADSIVPSGSVISQAPVGGTSVAEDTTVSLVVSSGPVVSVVPTVVGQTQTAATTAITAADLIVGVVTQQNHPSIAAGKVISQAPLGGVNATPGSAVDLVVSLGPAPAVPATLTLALSTSVVGSGLSTTILPTAFDGLGAAIQQAPPITYQILAGPGSTGTLPTISAGDVLTGVDTRGPYSVRGTIDGTSIVGDVAFSVIDGNVQSTNAAKFIKLGQAQGTVGARIQDLLKAYQSLAPASDVTAARTALTAALADVPMTGRDPIQSSTAVAPETGFLPDPGQLAAAGYPLTAHDVAFGNLIYQISAKLQQITAFYDSLSPDGTVGGANAVDQLNTLNSQLAALQSQLGNLNVTPQGIVSYAPQINRLMGNTIPAHLYAVTNKIVAITLQYPDPSNIPLAVARMPGAAQFFADLKVNNGVLTPGSFYGQTQPAFFGLLGLFGGASLEMRLVNEVYGPIMKEVSQMMAVLIANHLITQYLNTAAIGDALSGASLSFQAPGLPGSSIEGYGFDTTSAAGNETWFIGPEAFDAAQNLIEAFKPGDMNSIQDVYNYFKGIVDAIKGAQAAYDNAHTQPDDVATGQCLLDDSGGCTSLYFSGGFPDVDSTRFPSPVIILMRNLNNGSWASGIFDFVP